MSAPAKPLDLSKLPTNSTSGNGSTSPRSSFSAPPVNGVTVASVSAATMPCALPPPVAPQYAAAASAASAAPVAASAPMPARSPKSPRRGTFTSPYAPAASGSFVVPPPLMSGSSSQSFGLTGTSSSQLLSGSFVAAAPAAVVEKDHPLQPGMCVRYTAPAQIEESLESIIPAAVSLHDNDAVEPYIAPAGAAAGSGEPDIEVYRGENNQHDDNDHDCPVCLDPLSKLPAVQMAACQHVFHQPCITDCLHREPKCPVCRTPATSAADGGAAQLSLQGKCPTGTMQCRINRSLACPGFHSAQGTIEIKYTIPNGLQSDFHDHPGVPFQGTTRRAYLPNTAQGLATLQRLQAAWRHGLTFRVGTSLTTGQAHVVTWTSIHHKTSLHGGPHGFPDDGYLQNVNQSLTAVGVPAADSCPTAVFQQTLDYTAPTTLELSDAALRDILQPVTASSSSMDCVLCHAALHHVACEMPAVQIKQCRHAFHRPCLETYCQQEQEQQQQQSATPNNGSGCLAKCPICRVAFGQPLPRPLRAGKGPSGTMTIQMTHNFIELHYDLPDGKQQAYHVSGAGTRYTGCQRRALVPNSQAGRRLVTRLQFAFCHGLSFDIGTSLTSGQSNVVVWSHHVPHKTFETGGGPYGYPDDNYIDNCHKALDALGVPAADACWDYFQQQQAGSAPGKHGKKRWLFGGKK